MIALKVSTAAKQMDTDKGTIYKAIKEGKLRKFYIGQGKSGTIHVLASDLEKWAIEMAEEGKHEYFQ